MRCALRFRLLGACAAIASAAVPLSGCATGTPVGARGALTSGASASGYTRAAAPRAVPRPIATTHATAENEPTPRRTREQVVADARSQVGKKRVVLDGRRHPDDCTGLIRAVYGRAGFNVLSEASRADNAVTAIWRYAREHGRVYDGGRPLPGDLVFFRETYDLNRDGRRNDGLTHIGIVDEVRADGTVTVIHRVAQGVVRYRMNLNHPKARVHPETGEVVNDALRAPDAPGRSGGQRLTSELFAGYATLFP